MAECVSFALAEKIGKSEAHALLQELSKEAAKSGRSFRELAESDSRITAHIPATELIKLFMPTSYQGSAQTFIDRLVASAQGRTTVRRSIDLLMEAKPISIKTAREAPAAPAPGVAPPAPVPVAVPAPAAAAAPEPVAVEKPVSSEPTPVEPVAAATAPAPTALKEVPPAEVPTAIAPPAEPPKPPVEEPSALLEAFSRVAQATEQLNASKDSDSDRKAS
jgi:3-carboxy-cis,cis-muconate cycloisomerase